MARRESGALAWPRAGRGGSSSKRMGEPLPLTLGSLPLPLPPDSGGATLSYIKRGYTYGCRHAVPLLLVPIAASLLASLFASDKKRRAECVCAPFALTFSFSP